MMRRYPALLAPLALALTLASCGRGNTDRAEFAAANCPTTMTVQDASRLTRFKPGPGRDPRDVVFEASLDGAAVACSLSRSQMDVDVVLRVAVNAGPSVGAGVSRVPYFVRVLNASGVIVQGQEFNADFRLTQANPRGLSQEELTLRLPYTEVSQVQGFKIAVGLKPTAEELEYNRRSAARP
jgi:hypothetical protein